MSLSRYLETMIGQHQRLELLSQTHTLADVTLKPLNAKGAQNKPDFQSPETPAQRYLPVHKVHRNARIFMLQIQRFHIESAMNSNAVLHPKNSTVNLTSVSFGKLIMTSTYHKAVASKCTINHFEGLNAIESARSIPFSHARNSGHIKALPA